MYSQRCHEVVHRAKARDDDRRGPRRGDGVGSESRGRATGHDFRGGGSESRVYPGLSAEPNAYDQLAQAREAVEGVAAITVRHATQIVPQRGPGLEVFVLVVGEREPLVEDPLFSSRSQSRGVIYNFREARRPPFSGLLEPPGANACGRQPHARVVAARIARARGTEHELAVEQCEEPPRRWRRGRVGRRDEEAAQAVAFGCYVRLQRGAVVRRDAVLAAECSRRIGITREPAELQSLRGAVAQYDRYSVIGAANACEGDESQRSRAHGITSLLAQLCHTEGGGKSWSNARSNGLKDACHKF